MHTVAFFLAYSIFAVEIFHPCPFALGVGVKCSGLIGFGLGLVIFGLINFRGYFEEQMAFFDEIAFLKIPFAQNTADLGPNLY